MKNAGKKWFYLLIIALAAYTIKNIFVGVDNDETYGIVLGYRLANGDKLLLEMWEPHQTSAIFTALFIKPFLWISKGNVVFLNIYLRVIYFIVHGTIAWAIYNSFKLCFENTEKEYAKWFGLIFFVSSPKCIYIPEYSNLHMWFFTLLAMSFLWYYSKKSPKHGKISVLVLAGVFLTCDVLAYPSMALLYPVCIVLIWKKHLQSILKEVLAFSLPSVLGVLGLFGYIMSYMTREQIASVIPLILGDGSHAVSMAEKGNDILTSFCEIAVVLGIGAILAGIITWVYVFLKKIEDKEQREQKFFLVYYLLLMLHQFYCWFTSEYNASYPHIIYIFICLSGLFYFYKTKEKDTKGLFLMLFSFLSYLGIIIMSNWEPVHLIPYLLPGVLGGLVYWRKYWDKKVWFGKDVFRICCAIMVISNIFGYCYLIIGGADIHSTIFTVRGINRSGFRKGIFAEYMSAYTYNMNQENWQEAIQAGDAVLYVGPNSAFYMQGDCVIATGSTISTPTYDESLLEYWKLNPERYPDVVVFESMWGTISVVEEDSFMMQWLREEFKPTSMKEYPYVTIYSR